MLQVARNLLDPLDGFLRNATHLIHDRDPLFTTTWTTLLKRVISPAASDASRPLADVPCKASRPFVAQALEGLDVSGVDSCLSSRLFQCRVEELEGARVALDHGARVAPRFCGLPERWYWLRVRNWCGC
jgi:hypothetical protein